MNLNVFKRDHMYWKSLSLWKNNFKCLFRPFKYAYQRITKGYCDSDVWNADCFIAQVIANSINDLAENHYGYPLSFDSCDEEKNAKDWTNTLKEIAECFNTYASEGRDWSFEEEDTIKTEALRKGFALLQKYFTDLWD